MTEQMRSGRQGLSAVTHLLCVSRATQQDPTTYFDKQKNVSAVDVSASLYDACSTAETSSAFLSTFHTFLRY